MALNLTQQGVDISCEKLVITAQTNNANVDSVQMNVYVQGFNSNGVINTLEHVRDFGSADSFSFEVNDILRNFFEFAFYDFSSQFLTQKNVLATFTFKEVINGVVQNIPYLKYVNLKNFSLDVYESEEFVNNNAINAYDCGDAGSVNSKFLTSAPLVQNIYDFRNINLAVLKASFGNIETVTKTYLSNLAGSGQYMSFVDGLDGFIYGIPLNATQILKFNIATNAVTYLPTVTTGGWFSAKLNTFDGKIYGLPLTVGNDVIVFDVLTQTISYINNVTVAATNRAAMCITSTGIMYSPPYLTQSAILKVDTNTGISTEFGAVTDDYSGIFYASNGCSYAFAGGSGGSIMKIDHTNADAISYIHAQGNSIFDLGVNAITETGGFVYAFSDKHATSGTYVIFKIDLSDDSVTEIPYSNTLLAYNSVCLANNGLIYILREKVTTITVFNPATSGLSTFETLPINNGYGALTLATDGSLYSLPTNTYLDPQAILKISFSSVYGAKQEWKIKEYDQANVLVNTTSQDVYPTPRAFIGQSAQPNDIHCLNFEVSSVNDANKVTVQIVDKVGGAPRSELRTYYNVNFNKSRLRGVVVHWLNEFGVQDSFCFAGEFNRVVKNDSKNFTKVLPVNPVTTDLGVSTYNNFFNYEYELSTDRITQEVAIWLTKMLRSNTVCISSFDPSVTQKYYPIILKTADLLDESEYEPTTILTIKFTMANERKGIR